MIRKFHSLKVTVTVMFMRTLVILMVMGRISTVLVMRSRVKVRKLRVRAHGNMFMRTLVRFKVMRMIATVNIMRTILTVMVLRTK